MGYVEFPGLTPFQKHYSGHWIIRISYPPPCQLCICVSLYISILDLGARGKFDGFCLNLSGRSHDPLLDLRKANPHPFNPTKRPQAIHFLM